MILHSYFKYFQLSSQKKISNLQHNKLMQKINIFVNFIKIISTQSYYIYYFQSKNY